MNDGHGQARAEPVASPWCPTDLLTLRHDLPRAGALAAERRNQLFGPVARLHPCECGGADEIGTTIRGARVRTTDQWPDPATLHHGDRILVRLEPTQAGATKWITYLGKLSASPCEVAVAPFTAEPAGTFRLWAIAAARLALPGTIGVEARHDLIGIRLAQVALAFGADTLAGPVERNRALPLAGITRPNEHTYAGLTALITQAGLEARVVEVAST